MKKTLTPKERMLTAFKHQEEPDMVPVEPGLDLDGLARLAGKPSWEVYLNNRYLDLEVEAARKYGYDLWAFYGYLESKDNPTTDISRKVTVDKLEDKWIRREKIQTPLGELTSKKIYPKYNCAWPREKFIKDIRKDWPKLRYVMGDKWEWEEKCVNYDKIGDLGVYGISIGLPVDWWFQQRDGGSERFLLDFYDYQKELEEIFQLYYTYGLSYLKACLRAKPDEIVLGGSVSSMSIISPAIFETYNLPFIQQATQLCKQAGMVSHLHVCGKSKVVLEMVAGNTDLDVMEPLERPPGGDVDLGEAKKKYGHKLCLKGNVNTFHTMNQGTPKEVEKEVRACLDAAMQGGGYMLSTGDSCGKNIRVENMKTMIRVAREYGRY